MLNQRRDRTKTGLRTRSHHKSKPTSLTKKESISSKNRNESSTKTWSSFWKESEHVLILWLCRLLAFVQTYCYHDWQSLVFLIWLLHSTLYEKSSRFRLCMLIVYLPLFTATFLWYYYINIFGAVDWSQKYSNKPYSYFNFGFYQF